MKTRGKIKEEAWKAFSWYVRLRDWKKHGEQWLGDRRAAPCISCGTVYPIEGTGCCQAGHFIPGRKNKVLFDEQQVNAQCFHCNHHLKGNWTGYYKKMVALYGQEEVNKMIEESSELKQIKTFELEEMITNYKNKAKEYEL